jgi:hypothetical protein
MAGLALSGLSVISSCDEIAKSAGNYGIACGAWIQSKEELYGPTKSMQFRDLLRIFLISCGP